MPVITIHHAKTNLSRLIKKASAGEEIIIAKAGKPIARLVPLKPKRALRPLGTGKGHFVVPDDFNDPWPEIEQEFYGENPV